MKTNQQTAAVPQVFPVMGEPPQIPRTMLGSDQLPEFVGAREVSICVVLSQDVPVHVPSHSTSAPSLAFVFDVQEIRMNSQPGSTLPLVYLINDNDDALGHRLVFHPTFGKIMVQEWDTASCPCVPLEGNGADALHAVANTMYAALGLLIRTKAVIFDA